jgi:hypothetical protein
MDHRPTTPAGMSVSPVAGRWCIASAGARECHDGSYSVWFASGQRLAIGQTVTVQTFLPYADFKRSARVLDPKRLGKQRVEAIQVVRALTRPGYGWANHPAVLMWKGFEEALGRYGLTCCEVWTELGFGDTCAVTIATDLRAAGVDTIRTQPELASAGALPQWLGDEAMHRSHRSALVRKDPGWYSPHFPDIPDDLPYVWPVRSEAAIATEQRRIENAARRRLRALERARDV